MDLNAVMDRLKNKSDLLSPQLRIAARHMVANPEDVALNSMRSLAIDAGVKPPTMVRLAQALGFTSYDDLRLPFQEWIRYRDKSFTAQARDMQARTHEETALPLIRELQNADLDGLNDFLNSGGADQLVECAAQLRQTDHIYVLGFRSCFSLAYLFSYLYGIVGDNVLLVGSGGGTVADSLRHMGPADTLLAIGFKPYSRETVMAAQFARQRGAKVISLSDDEFSPISENAAIALTVRPKNPGFFHSLAPAMSILQMLVAEIVVQSGEQALNSIHETEQQLENFDAYWNNSLLGATGEH